MYSETNPSGRVPSDRVGTAYHEAGHAVMCYILGTECDTVSIIETEDAFGRVFHKPLPNDFDIYNPPPERRKQIADRIRILLSGEIAERHCMGDPEGDASPGSATDLRVAFGLAGSL